MIAFADACEACDIHFTFDYPSVINVTELTDQKLHQNILLSIN